MDVTRIDVIYIDDSAVIPGAQDVTDQVRQIVEHQGGRQAGLNFVPLKLQDIFADDVDDVCDFVQCFVGHDDQRRLSSQKSPATDSRSLLLDLFAQIYPPSTPRASIPSARSRAEDLHALLIQKLLIKTARNLGDAALLLGDSASRGAINLIESITKGRGHKWPVEGANIIWHDDVLVLRPLRDALAKELAFFNRTLALDFLTSTDVVSAEVMGMARGSSGAGGSGSSSSSSSAISSASTTGALEKASIGRLTENFIYSLEKGVPSTVSTVNRTGSKLVLKESLDEHDSSDIAPFQDFFLRKDDQDTLSDDVQTHLTLSSSSGLGQKGDRLLVAARHLPRWSSTRSGCPLCMLPTQRDSSEWKSGLSITGRLHLDQQGKPVGVATSSQGAEEQHDDDGVNGIPLHKYLCYSCTLILDVPEQQAQQRKDTDADRDTSPALTLPGFVLDNVQRRIRAARNATGNKHSGTTLELEEEADRVREGETTPTAVPFQQKQQSQDDASSTQGNGTHVTRRVGPEEIKGRVGQFLLDQDEDE